MKFAVLATLKEKLIHGKVLADVQTYFLDHFGEKQEFMEQGKSRGTGLKSWAI
jgi:hypothetical protein